MAKLNFHVGDIIRFHRDFIEEACDYNDIGIEIGERAKIVETGHRLDGGQWMNYRVVLGDGEQAYVRSKWITLCEECNQANEARDSHVPMPPTTQYALRAEKEAPMSILGSAVDKVRQLAMSTEDRLLRKYEVVDECGNVTAEGKALLVELLFNENKQVVVDKLKEIDAEAEKEKKKNK